MASRFGLDASGIGGGAPGLGAESEVIAGGRVSGTGGAVAALLLNPICKADRCGGGTMTLLGFGVFVPFVVGLPGSGGRSGDRFWPFDCRGGRDGLTGRSV